MSELQTIYVDAADHVEVVVETPPTAEPVDLAFIKDYAKISTSTDDLILSKLIKSATEQVEKHCQISLMPRTLKAIFTGLEYWKALPILPIIAISEVKSVLQDATETVFAASEYQTTGGPFDMSVHTPVTMTLSGGRSLDQIHITYTSGYADVNAIPATILEVIWLLVTLSYNQRDLLSGSCVTISANSALRQKLAPYTKLYL